MISDPSSELSFAVPELPICRIYEIINIYSKPLVVVIFLCRNWKLVHSCIQCLRQWKDFQFRKYKSQRRLAGRLEPDTLETKSQGDLKGVVRVPGVMFPKVGQKERSLSSGTKHEASCSGHGQSISVSLGDIKKFAWEKRLVLSLMSIVALILFNWVIHIFADLYTFSVAWSPIGLCPKEGMWRTCWALTTGYLYLDTSLEGPILTHGILAESPLDCSHLASEDSCALWGCPILGQLEWLRIRLLKTVLQLCEHR